MRECAGKKGIVFLLSATNSFAFSLLFLKPAVESGCGLDQNYIVEDELLFFSSFFFNYPRDWPPLEHQPTPAVRLNSLVLLPSSPQSTCLFCIVKLFAHFCLCALLFRSDPFHTFSALSAGIKWPTIPSRNKKKSAAFLIKQKQSNYQMAY